MKSKKPRPEKSKNSRNVNYLPNNVTFVLNKTYSQSKNLLAPFLLKRLKLKQRIFILCLLLVSYPVWPQQLKYLFTSQTQNSRSNRSNKPSYVSQNFDTNPDHPNINIHPRFSKHFQNFTNANHEVIKNINPKFHSQIDNLPEEHKLLPNLVPNLVGFEEHHFHQSKEEQNQRLEALAHALPNDQVGNTAGEFFHPPMNIHISNPPTKIMSPEEVWAMANNFINKREVYPPNHQTELSLILRMMATTKIIAADVLPRGTQLKLLLVLNGGQKVVFKPKRFERDYVVPGNSWDGFDRHNAEVAGFHLDSILHFRRAPLVVGKNLKFREEILPVATERLKATIRYKKDVLDKNGDPTTCFYGKCYYCKEEDLVCHDQNGLLEGTLTLWIEKENYGFVKLRHPYQRTYHPDKQARWEYDPKYCNLVVKKEAPYDKGPRLLDITDASIFDYLIGNGDRHHYETFDPKKHGTDAMLIMIDNAKSFGNSSLHDTSILAPVKQCCVIRSNTYDLLTQYKTNIGNVLDMSMKNDPIYPVLTQDHFAAMNLRMGHIFEAIDGCLEEFTPDQVIVDEWNGL